MTSASYRWTGWHWETTGCASRLQTKAPGIVLGFLNKLLITSENLWEALQCLRRFLGIISQNPTVSKSNRFHVVIFQFFSLIIWGIFRMIFLTWSVIFLKSWTSTSYFSNWTRSSVTSGRFFPFIEAWTLLLHGMESKIRLHPTHKFWHEFNFGISMYYAIHHFQTVGKNTDHFRGIYEIHPILMSRKLKDFHIQAVGLGNTRISS